MHDTQDFQPNWASKPGNTIVAVLQEQKLSLSEFGRKMNCSSQSVDQLLQGQLSINEEIAQRLEDILGASAEFWLKRELQYRETIKRLRRIEEEAWLKELPMHDMVKFGWLTESEDKITASLAFFNVPDVATWRKKYLEETEMIAFRTSSAFQSRLGAVSAWLRQGEILGSTIKVKPWNPTLFRETLADIRPLTRKKDPKEFIPTLTSLCAECGVALTIVRTPAGCQASGATKFLSPDHALLMLSFRYRSDDQFWFTFFHEAAHLLLHNNRVVFLEDLGEEQTVTQEEEEANQFAAHMLIPKELQSDLRTLRTGKRDIIQFAMEAGVSPGIVVGQLQYLGRVKHGHLNGYKRRYEWEDILA